MSVKVTPTRPYLLRGFYEWMLDNELTPHLVVNANEVGVQVPTQFVEDGQIVLNIAPHAIGNLQLGNDAVQFNARFGGKPHAIYVPLAAVEAIYARENGAGTAFAPEEGYQSPKQDEVPDEPPRPTGRPSLKVIK